MTPTTFRLGVSICAPLTAVHNACAQAFLTNAADRGSKVDVGVKPPVFEIGPIKLHELVNRMMRWMSETHGFSCGNISVKSLTSDAYRVPT